MNPLLPLYMYSSIRCYTKYLVYFHVALQRQKKVSLIVLKPVKKPLLLHVTLDSVTRYTFCFC